jgi:hypothetical protein
MTMLRVTFQLTGSEQIYSKILENRCNYVAKTADLKMWLLAPVTHFYGIQVLQVQIYLLPCDCEVRGHCMGKEMPAIPINRVVKKKSMIGENGGPRRRRGTRVADPPPQKKIKITKMAALLKSCLDLCMYPHFYPTFNIIISFLTWTSYLGTIPLPMHAKRFEFR